MHLAVAKWPSLIVQAGLASSKREAARFIAAGAVMLDGEKLEDKETLEPYLPGDTRMEFLLRVGRRSVRLQVPTPKRSA